MLEEELDELEIDACECSSLGGSVYMYNRALGQRLHVHCVIGVHYLKYTCHTLQHHDPFAVYQLWLSLIYGRGKLVISVIFGTPKISLYFV